MSSKKIYIVRHGQTKYNSMGIVQGSGVDSDINHIGQAQANAFFQKYKDVPFDKIYTSSLKRSQQSVMQFIECGIPFEPLQELDEICWGEKEGKKIDPQEDRYYNAVLEKWRSGETDYPIKGGESALDVFIRQQRAVGHIMKQENERTILICMHGRAMRIILSLLLNTPLKDMDQYKHNNLCLYLLEYDGEKFNAIVSNDLSHYS